MTGLLTVLAVGTVVIGAIVWGVVAVFRWARRRGRNPWVWVVGAYVAANVAWGIMRGALVP